MNIDNQSKFLRVTDSSTTEENPERHHEIKVKDELIVVTFTYGEETILPFEQGVKFMKDGFTVEEVDGSELELPVVPTDNIIQSLSSNECVARFTELKTDALKLRAAQKSGGEIYLDAEEEDRQNIIAFLTGNPAETLPNIVGDTESSVDENEEALNNTGIDVEAVVLDHFGKGFENPKLLQFDEREDGVVIFCVAETGEDENLHNVIATGTILELYDAALTNSALPDAEEEEKEEDVIATDEAIDLAKEHNINISEISGTGKNGKIKKSDVQKHIDASNPAA